jgi:hypothetical protein
MNISYNCFFYVRIKSEINRYVIPLYIINRVGLARWLSGPVAYILKNSFQKAAFVCYHILILGVIAIVDNTLLASQIIAGLLLASWVVDITGCR